MSVIYAWEGPAGSGKDFRYNKAKTLLGSNIIPIDRPVLPRCLENWAGAWSSSFMEYQAAAAATMSQKNVLCNRFLLSRWVYRAFQFNDGKLNDTWYAEMARSFRRLKTMAVAEAWDRMGQALYLHPNVEITVLLPDLHVLEHQRAITGKLYPFPAIYELNTYSYIAKQLQERPITGITIHIDRS